MNSTTIEHTAQQSRNQNKYNQNTKNETKLICSVKSPICPLFVIPAPYQVRDKLKQKSSAFRFLWTPAARSGREQVSGE